MPKWSAGCSERQLNAYWFQWIWTMHLSLQEPDPFLTAVQPSACCWEGTGSGFAVGCYCQLMMMWFGLGKANMLHPTLPGMTLLAHQPYSSFVCFILCNYYYFS